MIIIIILIKILSIVIINIMINIVPTMKTGTNFVFECVLVFFVFQANQVPTNEDWTGLSYISF